MKHLRYYSEFFSRDNVPYRIDMAGKRRRIHTAAHHADG